MRIVKRPRNKQVLKLVELFTIKFDNIQNEKICKCRFVVRGDLEKREEINLESQYASVASAEVTRLVLCLAATYGLKVSQADVVNAFLHSDLGREVYIELPLK